MDINAMAVAIFGSTGLISAGVTWWLYRRKNQAEAAAVLVKTSLDLIAPMKTTIDELYARVEVLEEEVKACYENHLADQVKIKTLELEIARYWRGERPDPSADNGQL